MAAIAGIATIFVLVPALYTTIKLAGAAYLLGLAWKAVRPGGESAFAPKALPADPPRRLFAMGLVTNLQRYLMGTVLAGLAVGIAADRSRAAAAVTA